MTRTNKGYGWIPDLPDHRDRLYAAPVTALAALPLEVDLRPNCPDIYNQEQLGSCSIRTCRGDVSGRVVGGRIRKICLTIFGVSSFMRIGKFIAFCFIPTSAIFISLTMQQTTIRLFQARSHLIGEKRRDWWSVDRHAASCLAFE